MKKLLVELLKTSDNLSTIEFEFNKKPFTFYYRYLTILEEMRIKQGCVKKVETIGTDGTLTVVFEKQAHLYPIHLILEKALNSDGKRLFSHTSKEDFKTVSNLPSQLVQYIATEMEIDIFRSLTDAK